MIKKIIIGFCLVFCFCYTHAQSFQFKIFKKIAVRDTTVLDTISILPNSLKILNGAVEINPINYQINFASTLLTWKIKPQVDSILVQYQTLPFLFSQKRFNKNPALIEEEAIDNKPYIYSIPKSETTIFNFDGFNKSGSISRGIGFGNNQDLAVNSNLVLQLSGKLNNEIEILAAISDDNIPIQPEGNTQQINDFDRVFIQLKRKDATLIAGDFELRKPDSYFTNYFKRTQGILIGNKLKDKNGNEFETSFAGAVAKGRSSKNLFDGIEGNQGPYRLTGNNREQFIIVISGTERVFLDGFLLLRGQDNDYVLDYNTAELTFTTKRLITRNSRIVVEFEYSDKVFARSLFQVNQKFQSKKLKIGFNYYAEQDNPNRPFLQTLSSNQQQFLQSIGNQIDQAVFPNVDSVAFSENEILYQRKDTLGAQGVYVYSPQANAVNYRVGFSFVGVNRGNYRINTSSIANGRVYIFIPPVNGLPQGDYSPVSLLITPKKQQLVTLNADYKLGNKTSVFSEIGLSNNDVNLYSDLQNQQNKGLAYKFIVQDKRLLKGNDSTGLKLKTRLSYEYVSQQFKPLERYRPVEFDRDFNFRGLPLQTANEYWSTISFQLFKSDVKQITYNLASFIRGKTYDGLQQAVNLNFFDKGLKINYAASLLNATIIEDKGNFLKQRLALSKIYKTLESGVIYEQETNRTANQITDVLAFQSFSFKQYDVFIKSTEQNKREFLVQYNQRFDDLPLGTNLEAFSKASTFTSKYIVSKNANSNLAINASYRSINYLKNDTINKNEETLLGRIDYNFRAIKGFLTLNSFYELGTGQEPKREFIYLEVPASQGIYAWNDYNNNNIKELNEFEISKYPDQAKFIKIFRPNNQFIRSNFTNINQTLTINPALLLKNKKAKSAIFISKFSNITSLRIDKKVLAGEGIIFNFYKTDIGADNLISLNSFVRNTFFFNRSNPIFGFDINIQKLANRVLLTNGVDSRNNMEQGLRLRWNFIRKSNFLMLVNQGSKAFTSQLFQNRNYQISYLELQPEFGYQFSTDFKTTLTFNAKNQRNKENLGGEKIFSTRFGGELRYNLLKKGTFSAQINLINNNYKGQNNSAVSYELLDGLQPGSNTTWSTGFQRTISNGIQLNFTYEGRKSSEVRTIHTGGLQVRAYF
jgi:hypothetical protein